MTPTEQNRTERLAWLRAGGEDFAARCLHGSCVGTDGTFINLTVETKYLRDSAVLLYQSNIAQRQAYYDSLGHALHHDVGSTMFVMFMTNTAGQFITSTTEVCFLKWQENQQAVAAMLDENSMNTYKTLDIQLVLDVADDAEASDAVNEILREHQRSFAPLSCLLDYSHGAYWDSGQLVNPSYEEGEFTQVKPEPESEFTQADTNALNALRMRGFAIVIFTPSELENMDDHVRIEDLEGRMISAGNDYIDDHEKED